MAGIANLARRLPTGAHPNGLSVFGVEVGDCCFKIKNLFLLCISSKYITKKEKSGKNVLTDWFYSGILTELSRRIVSSE